MRIFLLATFFLFAAFNSFAQTDVIMGASEPVVESCSGSFIDSGGQGGTGYSNNENFTVTICPDVPGDVVSVDFVTFNLDQSGPENSWDSMSIFDGDNTQAGTLGSYGGNSLQGLFVTATPLNTSGCLTFVFQSNGVGTGSFGGGITCDTPCDRPVAEATTSLNGDNKICVGEEVTFDGSLSFAAPGFNIVSYEWDFADGTPNEFDPVVTHAFAEPGEYVVELYLVDDNGCSSTNRISVQVLVATYPSFDPFPGDTTLCFGELTGEELCLVATPNEYEVTWSGPDISYEQAEDTELPDNVGECFQSEIEVAGFGPGQTMTDVSDLIAINVSIEHSWLFDLVVSITCPSGENVILHQQMEQPDGDPVGSSGTDLGESDTGTYYDYSWSSEATQGTWSQVGTDAGAYLPAGDYNSLQPLDNLVGCDLNGTWTFEICDLWGGDDGTLDYWGLEFNPAIIPDVTEFTPQIGEASDSSFWTPPLNPGLPILSESEDGNEICVMAQEAGAWEFTYTVTNDHGCSHDSTITVTVNPPVTVDAGVDVTLCAGQEVNLQAVPDGFPPPPDFCEYTLDMFDSFGDGWNGYSLDLMIDGDFEANYTIDAGDFNQVVFQVPGGSTFDLVMNGGAFAFEVTYELFDSEGVMVFSDGPDPLVGTAFSSSCGGEFGVDFVWTPPAGLSDPNIFNPVVTATQPTTYTVSMFPAGHPVCAFTDEVDVLSAYDFILTHVAPLCEGIDDGSIFLDIDEGSGTGPWNVQVTLNGGEIYNEANNGVAVNLVDLGPGDYEVIVSDEGGCSYNNTIEMPMPEPVVLTQSADTTICIGGTASMVVSSDLDPNSTWEYVWSNGLPSSPSVLVQPEMDTAYEVYANTPQGCPTQTAIINVALYAPLNAVIPDDTLVCGGGIVDLNVSNFSGGDGVGYFWYWEFNDTQFQDQIEAFSYEANESGTVCLVLNDVCASPEVSICMDAIVEEPLNPVFSSDVVLGCAPLEVNFINPNPPGSYIEQVWNVGEGLLFTNEVPSYIYANSGNYDVSLAITSNIGCFYEYMANDYISVEFPPEPAFFATPQPTRIPDTEISFYDQSLGNIATYDWVFDSLNVLGTSNLPNPVFEFPNYEPGVYPVTLTVTDPFGCSETFTMDIVISDLFNLYIPTAFTPNGDGVNDVFKFYGTDIDPDRFDLRIYNRWGEEVFHTEDINEPWVGGVDEEGQHYVGDNTYSYRAVIFSTVTDEREEITGSVTILR